MKKLALIITALFVLATTAGAATYTVTTTADTGAGSLRQAITDANASGTASVIQFALQGGGPHIITVTTPLPPITVKLDVDGYTQPGSIKPGATWPAKIKIQLNGNGINGNGLEFTTSATGSSVKGLSIVGFGTNVDHAGIYIAAPNVTVAGNLIGLKTDGTAQANSIGVLGAGADNVVVGGTTPDCRNVISGNTHEGITFIPVGVNQDNFASGELVQYNYVGTNVYGTAAIGNGMHGVDFDGANNSSILDNVIGGSGQYGIGCDATYSTSSTIPKIHDVTIMRNRIGIGVNGEDIGNGKAGIMVINAYNIIIGSSVANANIICYNENGVVVLDYPAGTASHTYDVAITYNRIYNNDNLGIDLSSNSAQLLPDGVTLNDVGDADTGPNELQNFPVITEAFVKDGILTIKGTIDTDQANANIIIVFFRNPKGIITPEPSEHGENYVRIGLIQVTTDASGDATFTANYPASTVDGEGQANAGDNIVAFSRGHNNQTSEYSKYYVVTAVPDEVCASSTTPVTYTVPLVEGATSYTWTVPTGATFTGQVTNTISVDWSAVAVGTYEIKVIASNACGNSYETIMPVNIVDCSTDLAITKTANPNPVVEGYNLTYTLTVTNTGTNAIAAQNVVVKDVLDTKLTFVSATPSVGTWSAPNWTIGTLAAGATATLQLVTTVQSGASNPTANSATVSSTTTDSNTANNTATTSTAVGNALSIACPASVTVACSSSVPAHATDLAGFNTAGGTVAGGTGPYTVTWISDVESSPKTCDNKYTITRTYRATDSHTPTPATQDCSQIITVFDNTPPSITCPPAVTVECASLIPAAATDYAKFVAQGGTASDNCTGGVTITHVIDEVTNQSCGNRYTLTRTYRATDLCGNSTDCQQVITINDQTAPTFTAPANVNIPCDASTDPDFTGRPTIDIGNCGGTNNTATYSDVITPGSCANNYSIARTWRVSDQCGNHTEHVQTITLEDKTPPVINCPGNKIKDNDAGKCSYTAVGTEFDPITATDNCGVKSVTYALTGVTTGSGANTLAGVVFNKGVTTVTWTITDNCDLSSTCSFTVTVNDTEKPTITPPADIIQAADQYKNYATITNLGSPIASDNCGTVTISNNAPSNNQYPIGNTTITWTVTDGSGNSTSTQTITVTYPEAYYWTGATDSDWNKTSNWVAGLIPGYNKSVEFATTSNFGTAAVRDLIVPVSSVMTINKLTNGSTKSLIVPAGATLNVTGVISGSSTLADASKIQVKATPSSSTTTPNGTFIINCDAQSTSGNPDVYVTVDLYAKGKKDAETSWVDNIAGSPTNGTTFKASYQWQHFGVPVETVKANPTFYGSFLREYFEDYNGDNTQYYQKWKKLTNSSELIAFKGYEITQDAATTYSIAGKLQYCDRDLVLTRSAPLVTTAGNKGGVDTNINNLRYGLGQNIFGNSYTASIDINSLTFPDRVEPTVYLYNTGRFTDWGNYGALNTTETLSAGQYTSIPQNAAPVIYDGKIPSLNGFLLIHRGTFPYYVSETDEPVTMKLPYANSLVTNTRPQTVARKPLSYMLVNLASKSTRDNLWLLSQPGTTNKLDDGWDGRKFFGTPTAFIYTENTDGPMQVSADKTIDGTVLNFYANSDTEYTLTLTKSKLDDYKDLHLIDLRTRTATPLLEEVTAYRFTADNKGSVEKRFVIANSSKIDFSSDKFKFLDAYVLNNNRLIITNFTSKDGTMYLYDAIGKTLMNRNITPYINDIPVALQTGVYILNLQADGKNQNIKLIIK